MRRALTALATVAAMTVAGAAVAAPDPAPDVSTPAPVAELPQGQIDALERDLGLAEDEIVDRLTLDATTTAIEEHLSREVGDAYAGTWLPEGADAPVTAVTDAALVDEVEDAGAVAVVVDHDLADLEQVKAQLDGTSAPEAVQAWYVDPTTNEVVVESTDPAAAREFRDDAGAAADTVRIETVDDTYEVARDVRGGDEFHRPTGDGYVTLCSVGFAVQGGFVTAGHCGSGGNAVTAPDGAGLGTYQASGWPRNDFAWVRTSGGWTSTPTVNDYAGGTVAVAGSAEQAIGASVCRSGRTTGWRCGVIEQKNVSVNYGEGDTVGLTIGTACAEGGDSGGSVISGNQAQGITSGRIGDCSSGGKFIYQPLRPALDAYGLSLVTTGGNGGGARPIVGYVGKCIDVPSSDFTDGKALQLWTCNGTNAQAWSFEGDGTVRISGMCMDVAWGSPDNGAVIQIAGCSGNPAQQFRLQGDGTLRSVLSGRCVDVDGWGTADGTRLIQWDCHAGANQQWRRA
ncbi:RICIN domain-containing protein [Cellulosimicrobium arenosum]|uniref:RICIN domain-containing protein n=1 Tax=Cellulosimicrobium arenosum TaxID=2708133 RepID=A0A927IZU4_9MICO|nr:ricin-type beta-trefoil lectin domain protein [Cellulosimicrobium arenosum]MBD8078773.1 RICIN domain-containing protein [Cellulosimicrobium arenosum]